MNATAIIWSTNLENVQECIRPDRKDVEHRDKRVDLRQESKNRSSRDKAVIGRHETETLQHRTAKGHKKE